MTGPARARLAGGLATVAVVAAVVAGLYVLGTPSEERVFRLDERRVRDLSALAGAVDVYWTRYQRLPDSLDDLRNQMGATVSPDAGSGSAYEYRVLDGGMAYELCATFERASGGEGRAGSDGFWSHRAGRQCFRRDAPPLR